MSDFLNGCTNIENADLSSWDVSNCSSLTNFVNNCSKLNSFYAPKNIKVSFSNFTKSTLLTSEHLMSIINNLVTSEDTRTLTLGSANLAKLNDEQIAIATNKGWTVS